VTEDYHVRLEEHTIKMLIDKIKVNFNEHRQYKSRNTTYDTILKDNIQQLAIYLQDRQKELHFNVPYVQLKRNDDNATRDFILNMTPEQRKELGINKSILWYIQKNL
jgi:CRISPR-associated protein Cas1